MYLFILFLGIAFNQDYSRHPQPFRRLDDVAQHYINLLPYCFTFLRGNSIKALAKWSSAFFAYYAMLSNWCLLNLWRRQEAVLVLLETFELCLLMPGKTWINIEGWFSNTDRRCRFSCRFAEQQRADPELRSLIESLGGKTDFLLRVFKRGLSSFPMQNATS